MIKILIIAWIAYLMVRSIRAGLRPRPVASYEPRPRTTAVETVKCPRCGTFVAEGAQHECTPAG